MVTELRSYFKFCEMQYGIKIPLQDSAPRTITSRLSKALSPFVYTTATPLKARTRTDQDLFALVSEFKLDCSKFAMANPNEDAIYEDLGKYGYVDTPAFSLDERSYLRQCTLEFVAPAFPEKFKPDSFAMALNHVNRGSSPGFPENMRYTTKADWLDDNSIDHEAIVLRYINSGVATGLCSFKEEVRPLEKLEDDKARSFISGNIAENIAWLVYCGPFFRALSSKWRQTPITYGMSELHRGWNFQMERSRGMKGKVTDMKQQDGSLDTEMQFLVADDFKLFIEDVSPGHGWPKAHEAIDKLISANCVQWVRMVNGVIFLKKQGNSSGNGATIQINSFSKLKVFFLWCYEQGLSIEQIKQKFVFYCHGDDGGFFAEGNWLKYLDFEKMNSYWTARGKLYRFEAENDVPQPAYDLSWLSRKSIRFADTWVPVPEEPGKLITSAILRNRPPKGADWRCYVIARFWQLAANCVFCSGQWSYDQLTKIGNRYVSKHVERDPSLKNNPEWVNANRHFKARWQLELAHTSTEKVWINKGPSKLVAHKGPTHLTPQGKHVHKPVEAIVKNELAHPQTLGRPLNYQPSENVMSSNTQTTPSAGQKQNGVQQDKKQVKKQVKAVVKSGLLQSKKPVNMKKAAKSIAHKGQIHGRGDFWSDAWSGIKKFGKTVLVDGIAKKGIPWLTKHMTDAMISGAGDYHVHTHNHNSKPVHQNSMYAGAVIPTHFGPMDQGSRYRKREPVMTIYNSDVYQRNSITINPGLGVFPWISESASAFQKYRIHGMVFEYVPNVNEANPAGIGTVNMSVRTDLTSAAPQSLIESEIPWGSAPANVCETTICPVECKRDLNSFQVLNIRFADLPVGSDQQVFDFGILDVTNQGNGGTPGTVMLGQVFCNYDIEMLFPIAEHLTNSVVQSYCAYSASTTANPYGATWVKRPGTNMPIELLAGPGSLQMEFDNTEPLPVGSTWLVQFIARGSGANITTQSTVTLSADLADYPIFMNGSGIGTGVNQSGVSSVCETVSVAFKVQARTGNQALLLSSMVIGVGFTGYDSLMVTPIVSGLAETRMRARHPSLYELSDRMQRMESQYTEMKVLAAKVEAFSSRAESQGDVEEGTRFLNQKPLVQEVETDDEQKTSSEHSYQMPSSATKTNSSRAQDPSVRARRDF